MWSREPLLFLHIALHRMSSLLITNNYNTNPVMLKVCYPTKWNKLEMYFWISVTVVIIFYTFHYKITNRSICMILFVFANNILLRAQSLLRFHHNIIKKVIWSWFYYIFLYPESCIWWSPFTAFNLRTVSPPFAMIVYSVCSCPDEPNSWSSL